MDTKESSELLKKLFLEVGVASTWKWDDAQRNVKDDSRYQAIKMSM